MYVLKHRPEDFVVEEIAHLDLKPIGSHLVIKATKRERNTEEVAQFLADRLRIPRRDVGYAGAKDRNAITTQHFSLKGVREEEISNVTIPNVTITVLGYLDSPLGLGALEGNRFTITVRNLDDESISLPKTIPNYFDEQRFGANNAAIGKAIVRKEWKAAIEEIRKSDAPEMRIIDDYLVQHPGDGVGALIAVPRQLLRMYLHAYQSLLWNRALATYISQKTPKPQKLPYSGGEFVFPDNDADMDDAMLPMPGFSATTLDSPLMTRVLAEEGITPRDFVIRQLPNLSLEGTERAAFVEVEGFAVSQFENDETFPGKKKVILSFVLPKGSYATIVVKALLKNAT